MKRINVKDLEGTALDWAVAKCEEIEMIPPSRGQLYVYSRAFGNRYAPSQAHAGGWNIAGPIIEHERIDVVSDPNGTAGWMGKTWVGGLEIRLFGATALVAAMRCYVMTKLGDEVEVPKELIGE